ncbi:MAG: TIGR04076 family protein [Promethearchaeota archaeon]
MKHLRIRIIQKTGKCLHNVGDTWETPYALNRPEGLCDDAHYVLIPYLCMAAGSAKSWETDGKWRIHCPSKKGIIFEIEVTDRNHQWPDSSLFE